MEPAPQGLSGRSGGQRRVDRPRPGKLKPLDQQGEPQTEPPTQGGEPGPARATREPDSKPSAGMRAGVCRLVPRLKLFVHTRLPGRVANRPAAVA